MILLYKELHSTIEQLTSKIFISEEEMLSSVINEIVAGKIITITGGRVWKLFPEEKCYRIIYQTGKMDKISSSFSLKLKEDAVTHLVARERTILGNETNVFLKSKGISKYAASGVGNRIKIDAVQYYEYLIAFNSENLNREFKYLLNIIAAVITSKVKQMRASSKEEHLKADLDKARELQKSILPQHEYIFHDYELYGLTLAAEIVTGDFFDYLESGEDGDRIGIILGDAASKGVAAAAEAMYISGALRMASTFEIKIAPLMKKMNRLVNKIFSDDKFTSLFYGELSTDKKGLFLYASAGHNPPIFIKAVDKSVHFLPSTGPVLGPAPKANYTVENINFSSGDVLVIFSDGVVESADPDFEQFGEERLIETVLSRTEGTAKDIALSIVDAVLKFSKNGMYVDDKTVIVIKKTK